MKFLSYFGRRAARYLAFVALGLGSFFGPIAAGEFIMVQLFGWPPIDVTPPLVMASFWFAIAIMAAAFGAYEDYSNERAGFRVTSRTDWSGK